MAREILINAAPFETRVALVERLKLVELFIERPAQRGVMGNVYKGRVTRVLPGMQAAFVDIGLEHAGYLHASDLDSGVPPMLGNEEGGVDFPGRTNGTEKLPIEQKLKRGHELLVQVARPPVGSKGARVTTNVSLAGRFLIATPGVDHIGISKRIADEAERLRLKEAVGAIKPVGQGFIIRTAAEGLSKREVQDDVKFLDKLWTNIRQKADSVGPPALLHQDMDVVLRIVRDFATADTHRILVDDPEQHQRVLEFVRATLPKLADHVELFEGTEAIFDRFGIEPQISKALERKIWLKSGGYIIFDHTEALTVIDVNTGRFIGKKSQADTILKTNLEAVTAIVEQIRLRNIGGLIVIDLIDMVDAAHRRTVFEALREAVKRDKSPTRLLPISELGLIEMTRRRNRESLSELLCESCFVCHGGRLIKSSQAIAYDVLRRLGREATAAGAATATTVRAVAHPAVVRFLRESEAQNIQQIEARSGKHIVLKPASGAAIDRIEIELIS